MLENLALRQQLGVLKRRYRKPRLGPFDKLFWWWRADSGQSGKTRFFWSHQTPSSAGTGRDPECIGPRSAKDKGKVGGKKIPRKVRDLIFHMVSENPTWGAPRIHGELLMLGFEVSERTIPPWLLVAPLLAPQPHLPA
jgi:putative transposase